MHFHYIIIMSSWVIEVTLHASSLVEMSPAVLKKIFKSNAFSLYHRYVLLGNRSRLFFIWISLNFLHQRFFLAKFHGNKRKGFSIVVSAFALVPSAFIFLLPRIISAKFGWNCSSGSREDLEKNVVNVYLPCR